MSAPQVTAKGSLEATPLPHLLVYCLDKRLTGSLVLEAPGDQRSAIWLENGIPAKAKSSDAVIHLGRLLLEQGVIDEATLNQSLAEMAQRKQLHGTLLVARGSIDAKTLIDALQEQVARKVAWMYTLPPQTLYGFYQNHNFLENWGGPEATPVEPLAVIWQGLRQFSEPAQMAKTLTPLAGKVLRLHRAAQLGRFGFGPAEKAVTDIMRAKPQPLEELAGMGLASRGEVERLIYALAVTRHLDLGDEAPPVGVGPSQIPARPSRAAPGASRAPASRRAAPPPLEPPPEPVVTEEPKPPSTPSQVLERKAQIRDLAGRIDKMNFYQMLEVDQKAKPAEIQAAFFAKAKLWHPDRLGNDLADVRDLATSVFARMSEAHQTLEDPKRREEYDELIKQGGGTPEEQEQVQKVLEAVTEFQKAEVLVKRKHFKVAEVHAKNAFEADPGQPEYRALYAWIRAMAPNRAAQGYEELVEDLDKAVEISKKNSRIRFWRAQVLKLAGEHDRALTDYKFVVKAEPNNLDAVRELRLASMRGETVGDSGSKDAEKKGGFFGKLFKRD